MTYSIFCSTRTYKEITNKNIVLDLFMNMSSNDRNSRFLSNVSDSYIENYVYSLCEQEKTVLLGAFENDKLVGVAEIIHINNEHVELAFFVDKNYRNIGIGNDLFKEVLSYISRKTNYKYIHSICRRTNTWMRHIIKKTNLPVEEKINFDEVENIIKINDKEITIKTYSEIYDNLVQAYIELLSSYNMTNFYHLYKKLYRISI